MTIDAKDKTSMLNIRLACIEISRFRRLSTVRVAVDAETTILVGANNSGKTSILIAIRQFLAENPALGAFDLSVDQWPKLRTLGEAWEALAEDPASDDSNPLPWDQHLQDLLACMPTLDLWFDAKPGAFHLVSPFIPSLQWSGGPVGVRLRLEPASTVVELQKLAWRFREARQPVRILDISAKAWPIDILDYWLRNPRDLSRVVMYKLDPVKGPLSTNPTDRPQELTTNAVPVDHASLTPLIRVDFVPAQRGLGAEEANGRPGTDPHRVGLFSNQMHQFARQHLSGTGMGPSSHPELVAAVAKAQGDLDAQIQSAMAPSIKDVRKLGYPGLHDPQEINFRTRIQTADLLDHNTAIQYRLDGQASEAFLPEHAIGLGYQNLQSLSYQLVSFRETRLNPPMGGPAAVHLVMVEEPEAHLHVQVQRVFPLRALQLITSEKADHAHLASQLILTTHASHLAHAESFTRLRYVRRLRAQLPSTMPSSEVVNLADAFGGDEETRTFAERYFQVQHTDLLFADAAIFVEGTAERMLVPLFIEKDFHELRSRYISFLDIGGSHAHRLRPLVERLGIPTVVITDIDPVRVTKGPDGKSIRKVVAVSDPKILECGNATLTGWHPMVTGLTGYAGPTGANPVLTNASGSRVRFAWQVPIPMGGPWPSSFEDAFILTNLDWFRARTGEKGAVGSAIREVNKHSDQGLLNEALHELLHGDFNKGDFAATIFERLSAGEQIQCPAYISDALVWLQQELEPTATGGQA